jgi:microcystin degradation protein MlrC
MGEPVIADATVTAVSATGDVVFKGPYGTGSRRSFGRSACLDISGFAVIVAERNLGIYDLEQFRIYGVEPSVRSVVVVKCMQGHHAAFDPIASRTLDVDTGGLTSADLTRFRYTKVRTLRWIDARLRPMAPDATRCAQPRGRSRWGALPVLACVRPWRRPRPTPW